jgi:chromosome segregation ATPase
MKTRIVLGVGLFATLLAVPVIVKAQPQTADDQLRLQQLIAVRAHLGNERSNLEQQNLSLIRNLDARQNQLKRELEELAAKRAELERSFARRRGELLEHIGKVESEIQAFNASVPSRVSRVEPPGPIRDSVEAKLDQILKRLDMMETRLDRLERAVKSPPLERTPPK